MRIYNATSSQISLPFPGGRLDIQPHAVSGNVGANTEVISLLVSAYSAEEIAFIVSGPFELNLCSSIPTVPIYTVQSLEEAIARFNKVDKKAAMKEVVVEEPVEEKEEPEEEECECECESEEEDCECEDECSAKYFTSADEPAMEEEVPAVEEKEPEAEPKKYFDGKAKSKNKKKNHK